MIGGSLTSFPPSVSSGFDLCMNYVLQGLQICYAYSSVRLFIDLAPDVTFQEYVSSFASALEIVQLNWMSPHCFCSSISRKCKVRTTNVRHRYHLISQFNTASLIFKHHNGRRQHARGPPRACESAIPEPNSIILADLPSQRSHQIPHK